MINAKTVRGTLNERLQGDGTLLKDFADIATFGTVVLTTTTPITGPGLLLLIMKTAGACLSAATRIIGRLSIDDSKTVKALPHSYERFRVLFYVACQKSYFEALISNSGLKRLSKAGGNSSIDPAHLTKTFIERVAQIEEAEVRFHYSINPTERGIPLYEAYSHWLSAALAPLKIADREKREIIQEISLDAKRRLNVALATSEPAYEWIRNYLALSATQETSEQVLSELAAIRSTLQGWKGSLDHDASRRSERWANYRELMRSLPDQKESMYNEDFGVSKVFVTPRIQYHRAGLPGGADEPEIAPDLARLLGALVSNRLDGTDLIVLCGGPGSGKSTLCRILASELAKDEAVHPIFLKLRRCRETAELSSFIEDSLVREGVILRLADLQLLPNVILILDGFDELVLASKTKLKHFFASLIDDIRSGPLRKARVIVSGRDTLFPKGEGLPRGSHILNVLPFDEPRIALWGERWRSLHLTQGAGSTFHPELLLGDTQHTRRPSPLRQLAAWPLTLHLLAKVHTAGLVDLGSVREGQVEKAYLYRSILRETAMRQTEQATGKGRLAPDQMREFLRTLAWAMYSRALDSMAIEDVLPLAKAFFPGQDETALTELAEVAIVNAPEIQRGEETGFEFVHKSFSEYLVAELIARAIEHVSYRITDIEGNETWRLGSQEAARGVAEVLSIRVVPREVQEMLEPMLGSFVVFYRGEKVEDTVSSELRLAGLRRVRERFQDLYQDFLNGASLSIVTEVIRSAPLISSPLEAYANYGIGIVLMGAATGRRSRIDHSETSEPLHFCLEPFEGAFWRWLMLAHVGGVYIDGEVASRLYDGVGLNTIHQTGQQRTGDWSLPIKLGLLQSIPGYQPDLKKAIEQQHRTVLDIVHILSTLCFLMTRMFPSDTTLHEEDKERGPTRQEDVFHFLEHVFQSIVRSEDDFNSSLERGGLMPPQRYLVEDLELMPPQQKTLRERESTKRPRSFISKYAWSLDYINGISTDRLAEVYRAVTSIFCVSRNDQTLDQQLKQIIPAGTTAPQPPRGKRPMTLSRGVRRAARKGTVLPE